MCLCIVVSLCELEHEYMEYGLCIVASLCELEHEYIEYTFVHSCFIVWAITRIHRICAYILLFLLLNQNSYTWSMCLCIVDSLCELELEYMEYVFMCCYFFDWTRTRIHGVCVCALFIFCVSWISNIFLHAWLIYCCLTLSEHFSSPLIK